MSSEGDLWGAVEAGGTKFRAGIFNDDLKMVDHLRVPTSTPGETIDQICRFIADKPKISALGIASFGPIIVDADSPRYGDLAETPKVGWSGFPLLNTFKARLGLPADIQTDVEAAAVAEQNRGAGKGLDSIAYLTVGTGVGVGVVIDGTAFRGRDHIELGHIPVERFPGDDFEGICRFHGSCLEGLASGPALKARWGTDPRDLGAGDQRWELQAHYLAQLVVTLTYGFAPDRIVIGGGVGLRPHLAPRISAIAKQRLAGYSISHRDNNVLAVTASLGNDSGLVGAALLAKRLARVATPHRPRPG